MSILGANGKSSHLSVTLAIVVATTIIGTAFAADSSEGETSSETVLRMGFLQKVDSLNPNVGLTEASLIFSGLVYDCLQSVDENLESAPNLARAWRIAEGFEPYGSVWDYNLTGNAYWHDGEPFTADDVVFTLNLNAEYYQTMWAYQPYGYFIDYAEKIADYTVRVHFYDRATGEPMPVTFGSSLLIPILPEHKLGTWSPSEISFSWTGVFDGSDPPIVGTGPFMATEDIYDEFLQGDKLTLVKNPNYFWKDEMEGAPEISFDRLRMRFFNDATAMVLALEVGILDVAQFPPHDYIVLKNKVWSGQLEDVVTYDGPKCTQYWTGVLINHNNAGPNPSRLDPIIRQAMTMATDKAYINDNFYLGLGEPGSTLISPISEDWHYQPTAEELYDYDLSAAESLLEAGGYRYTDSSPDVRVCTADSYAVQEGLVAEDTPLTYDMGLRQEYPEEKDIAMYLEYEWAKIGVQIDYTIMTEAALGAYVYSYAYDTAIWYWSSDPDPSYALFCHSKASWAGWNDNMYTSVAYEENFTKQVQEFDEDLRNEYVDNCQRTHYLDVGHIILNYVGQTYAWRTDTFTGWGDWAANPGRSIDACWGGNPLYFDLEYIEEVEIDDDPPVSSVSLSGTEGGNGWYTSSVYLTIEADDGFGEGVLSTAYRLDDGPWSSYSMLVEVSGDGIHSVDFFSLDLVGNVENVQTLEIKIDKTAPELALTVDDGTEFTADDVNLSWACSDACSGVEGVEYTLDDGTYIECGGDDWVKLLNLSLGEHVISMRIYDEAGNTATQSLTFTVKPDDGSDISDYALPIGIAVACAAAAIALFLMYAMRRRSGQGPSE